jgi:hypothetical protein
MPSEAKKIKGKMAICLLLGDLFIFSFFQSHPTSKSWSFALLCESGGLVFAPTMPNRAFTRPGIRGILPVPRHAETVSSRTGDGIGDSDGDR